MNERESKNWYDDCLVTGLALALTVYVYFLYSKLAQVSLHQVGLSQALSQSMTQTIQMSHSMSQSMSQMSDDEPSSAGVNNLRWLGPVKFYGQR